jgi:hypothetical protein
MSAMGTIRARNGHLTLITISISLCALASVARADDPPTARAHTRTTALREPLRLPLPPPSYDPLLDPVSEQGQRARGLYVTGPYARRVGHASIASSARRAGLDAVVIDMKDGAGRVTYETNIEILQPQVRNYLGDVRALNRVLDEEGIYSIARIVCFADPQLPHRHPDRAILDVRPNRRGPWRSWGTAGSWLDPYNRVNHDMIVELAREAEQLGFDEVQLDYIRFPVDDGTPYAQYPADEGRPRWEVLKDLLRRIDDAIRVPLGVDVFGLTAFDFGDTRALGQNLEEWAEHVEVFTPMLYLNSMRTWGLGQTDRDRRLIEAGVTQLRRRLGPTAVIRPFLQSFEEGADRPGPVFIANQIVGARRGGADGYLFWHPGSRYTMLYNAARGAARDVNVPFPLRRRDEARARAIAAREAEHAADEESETEPEPEEATD